MNFPFDSKDNLTNFELDWGPKSRLRKVDIEDEEEVEGDDGERNSEDPGGRGDLAEDEEGKSLVDSFPLNIQGKGLWLGSV